MVKERLALSLFSLTKHQSWGLILDELDNFVLMNVLESDKNDALSQFVSDLKRQDVLLRFSYKKFSEIYDFLYMHAPIGTTFWSLILERNPPCALPQELQRYSKDVFISMWTQYVFFKSKFDQFAPKTYLCLI